MKSEAILKAISKEIAKVNYQVDNNRETEYKATFKIEGSAIIRKGFDHLQQHVWSIDWASLFLFTLNKLNGVTAESILKEFLQSSESENETLEIAELKKRSQVIINEVKETSTRKMEGKITIKDMYEICTEIEVCKNC